MAVAKQLKKDKAPVRKKRAKTSRKPRSKTGSTAAKRTTSTAAKPAEPQTMEGLPEEQDGAELEGVDGAKRLQDSANKEVARSSDEIARGLVDKAAEGNPACTKMLLDLMAGKTVAPKKLLHAISLSQMIRMDKPWEGPAEEEEDGEDGE